MTRELLEQTQQRLEEEYQRLQVVLEQTKAELNAAHGALRLNEQYLALLPPTEPSVAPGDDAGQAAVPGA